MVLLRRGVLTRFLLLGCEDFAYIAVKAISENEWLVQEMGFFNCFINFDAYGRSTMCETRYSKDQRMENNRGENCICTEFLLWTELSFLNLWIALRAKARGYCDVGKSTCTMICTILVLVGDGVWSKDWRCLHPTKPPQKHWRFGGYDFMGTIVEKQEGIGFEWGEPILMGDKKKGDTKYNMRGK